MTVDMVFFLWMAESNKPSRSRRRGRLARICRGGRDARASGCRLLRPGAVAKYGFNTADALTGWIVAGDAGIDLTKDRQSAGGSLKIGPGGSALLKLRAEDGSGKVELWVYDDGSKPADGKATRVGPRWGLVQSDGRLIAAGILHASYLAGDEGYTATACDGKDWLEQLFWLGVNRAPSGWHKWTFDFDPEAGIRIFHNDKEVGPSLDKANLKGFGALEIWGDSGRENGQTIWVDDVSVVLGGPAHLIVAAEADPVRRQSGGGVCGGVAAAGDLLEKPRRPGHPISRSFR